MLFHEPDSLPCGCRRCGCLCEDHSPSGCASPCPRHGLPIVARWIAAEVAALCALSLLIASAAVWCSVLTPERGKPSFRSEHFFSWTAPPEARH